MCFGQSVSECFDDHDTERLRERGGKGERDIEIEREEYRERGSEKR